MDYLLTIRVPFQTLDDALAREEGRKIQDNISEYLSRPETVKKLQRLNQNKEPVKVDMK